MTLRGVASLLSLTLLSIGLTPVYARECRLTGPRYQLQSDTVEWRMEIENGQSCIRGVRFRNVADVNLTLTSPPRFGKVVLLGPAFSYSAKVGFQGDDSFTVAVSGTINKVVGNSTIRVLVSIAGASKSIAPALSASSQSPSASAH